VEKKHKTVEMAPSYELVGKEVAKLQGLSLVLTRHFSWMKSAISSRWSPSTWISSSPTMDEQTKGLSVQLTKQDRLSL
jgi:hypothetical protein